MAGLLDVPSLIRTGLLGEPAPMPSGLLGETRQQKLAREMTHRPMAQPPMHPMDALALGAMPLPVIGDIAGLLADARRFVQEPQSRTALNFGLAGLGLLPVVPGGLGGAVKPFQTAVRNTKTGETVSGGPIHIANRMEAQKRGMKQEDLVDGFIGRDGEFLTRSEAFDALEREVGSMSGFEQVESAVGPRELESNALFDFLQSLRNR
jgi:hypothetical protein